MSKKKFRYPISRPSVLALSPDWRSTLRDRLSQRDAPVTVADLFDLMGIPDDKRCHGDGIRLGLEAQNAKWRRTVQLVDEDGQRRSRIHYVAPRNRAARTAARARRAEKAAAANASVMDAIHDAHQGWSAQQAASDAANAGTPRRAPYTNAPASASASAARSDTALAHLISALAEYRRERAVTLGQACADLRAALGVIEEALC